jgi:hypothetical protein
MGNEMGKILLIVTAAVELSTGLVLLGAPSAVARLLFGSPLETPMDLLVGRVTGDSAVGLILDMDLAGPANVSARDKNVRVAVSVKIAYSNTLPVSLRLLKSRPASLVTSVKVPSPLLW